MPLGIPDVTLEVAWGPRSATLDDCADASLRFLKQLGPFFSGFRAIRLVSARKKRAVQLNLASLKEALQTGVNRTDVGHEIIPELGFCIGLAAKSSTDPGYEVQIDLNIG